MSNKFYTICTTPRSGSNLLCNLLESSRVMGNPREILNLDSVILPFAHRHNLIDSESKIYLDIYLDHIVQKFSSENNVFGMKLLLDQFEPYMELNVIRKFISQFKFIWLFRKDVLSQAISMYIAQETNEWTSINEKKNHEKENKRRRDLVDYNEEKINQYVNKLTKYNLYWIEFFSINQLDYLPISYEDILENPEQICKSICNYCGVTTDYKFSLEQASFKKQGNNLNEKFKETFRKSSFLNLAATTEVNKINLRGIQLADNKMCVK